MVVIEVLFLSFKIYIIKEPIAALFALKEVEKDAWYLVVNCDTETSTEETASLVRMEKVI